MKRIKILIVVLIIVSIVSSALAIINYVGNMKRESAIMQMKKIKYGMSLEEVEQILGPRIKENRNYDLLVSWKLDDGSILRIEFFHDSNKGGLTLKGYFVE